MVRTLETNATGSQQNIPSEYAVENYGTTASIENNNAIGSENTPNNELGVALWLAGYEQGRTGDLQITPNGAGSTTINVTHQTTTAAERQIDDGCGSSSCRFADEHLFRLAAKYVDE